MAESPFPQITLVRHGETAWSRSGQHTGRSDIPLTPEGEDAARALAPRLARRAYAEVWSSPSGRAATTCALAGFGDRRAIDPDLAEWDYGAYEGRTTKAILAERPDWRLFRDGCPGGETAADVGEVGDRQFAVAEQHQDAQARLLRGGPQHAQGVGEGDGGGHIEGLLASDAKHKDIFM